MCCGPFHHLVLPVRRKLHALFPKTPYPYVIVIIHESMKSTITLLRRTPYEQISPYLWGLMTIVSTNSLAEAALGLSALLVERALLLALWLRLRCPCSNQTIRVDSRHFRREMVDACSALLLPPEKVSRPPCGLRPCLTSHLVTIST